MTDAILVTLAFVGAVGSGMIGGVFYAFSTFVMKALARLPAGAGIAAMQSINIAAINPLFLGAFLGTAAVCVAVMIGAVMRLNNQNVAYLLAGAALYLVGTFLVTLVFNVPLNNRLAAVAPDDSAAAARWTDYLRRWTAWNHVRTAAALLALVSFVLALSR